MDTPKKNYLLTMTLVLTVLLNSCTSIYQVANFFHESAHEIASFISGNDSHDHTHDILKNLENHDKDSDKNKYLLDKNIAKISNEISVLDDEDSSSTFSVRCYKVKDMLGAFYMDKQDRPPTS